MLYTLGCKTTAVERFCPFPCGVYGRNQHPKKAKRTPSHLTFKALKEKRIHKKGNQLTLPQGHLPLETQEVASGADLSDTPLAIPSKRSLLFADILIDCLLKENAKCNVCIYVNLVMIL